MTLYELIAAIIQTALDELDQWNVLEPPTDRELRRQEDVTEVIIEQSRAYKCRGWSVYLNKHDIKPTWRNNWSTHAALAFMTILYADGEFFVDDL